LQRSVTICGMFAIRRIAVDSAPDVVAEEWRNTLLIGWIM
jgi:hypothetical protein